MVAGIKLNVNQPFRRGVLVGTEYDLSSRIKTNHPLGGLTLDGQRVRRDAKCTDYQVIDEQAEHQGI